jgi:glycosyltransferase involved in cell wall biosynthesis
VKVVILHDWLTTYRGAERLLDVFCEIFPKAPIYTLIHTPGSVSETIESREIHQSFLGKIPGIENHYRKFLPLFPMAAESLIIPEDTDLILSSSHCVIKGVRKPRGARHICYIHSPMRYIYDQFPIYFGPQAPLYQRVGAHIFRDYLKLWDKKSNENVDQFIANSNFVKERVENYYQRQAEVIFPFVELDDFQSLQGHRPSKENYFVVLSAFAPNKRIDLAVEAFNQLGPPLKIIGSGQLESQLKSMAKSNIEFLGNLSRKEVVEVLSKAQAMIFPSLEDFGITPLESLAAGTPVIAYGRGGVLDTLNERTSILFPEQTVESLMEAVRGFNPQDFDPLELYKRAAEFSRDNFKKQIQEAIS